MRHSRTHYVIVPPTTDRTIVFPYIQLTNKFETNFYSPVLTDDRLSTEELNQYLTDIENHLKIWRSGAIRRFFPIFTCLFVLVIIGCSLSIPLVATSDSESNFNIFPVVFPILFGSIFVFICCTVGS